MAKLNYIHADSQDFQILFPFQNDEEPLNSDDDIDDGDSDEEGGGDFETEDTIVCQWEKVRNCKATLNFVASSSPGHSHVFNVSFLSRVLKKIGDEARVLAKTFIPHAQAMVYRNNHF